MFGKHIFFLHNPKAGGTSIGNILRGLYKAEDVAPSFSCAPNDHRKNRELLSNFTGYKIYIGHYGYEYYEKLGCGFELITNFRHPVARIYSLYRYWRQNVRLEHLAEIDPADKRVVAFAHELSFSDFIRHPDADLRLYLENAHFRQLHRCNWTPKAVTVDSMATVKRRIDEMPWFFIAEEGETSARLFQRFLPEIDVQDIPRDNISTGVLSTVSDEDAAYIEQINDADLKIYEYALQIQQKRSLEL